MQTKRSEVTEKDVERWTQKWLKLQKEGIYLPWLEVREVPSTSPPDWAMLYAALGKRLSILL